MPEISVLMAVHNPNIDYFQASLNAIRDQTFRDFELVIVDDATTTCCIDAIIKNYDIDYKIVHNPINLGLAKSLNRGLSECCGTYIARIDDDDIMRSNRLEQQYNFAKEHDGFIFCNVDLIDADGVEVNESSKPVDDIKKYLKKSGNCLTHSTLFVRRSILLAVGGYDERFIYAQDYALYMSVIDEYDFFRMREKMVLYRIPAGRSSKMKRVLSILSCYGAAINYFWNNKCLKNYLYFVRRSMGLFRLLLLIMVRE